MPKKSDYAEKLKSEINALSRQVAKLQGIEQHCRQVEAELKALEERNRLLGDSVPLGIFTIDAKGVITGISRKMLEMLPWLSVDNQKTMGLSDCQALVASRIFADIQRCIVQKEPIIAEHLYTDPQGECAHLRFYFSPVPGVDDPVSEVMAIVEDYTDQKRMEEKLRESEKRYRQLFQSAPIALIERDASRLKAHLEQLRASGISDLREYLGQNPNQVYYCWSLIKTVDYNPAFLELMGLAESAAPNGTIIPIDSKVFLEIAKEIILVVAEGEYHKRTGIHTHDIHR